MKLRGRKNFGTQGFTLIDLMVAMGLGAVAVTTTIAIVSQAGRVRREENMHTTLLALRNKIYNSLQRFDDFQATIHYAGNAAAPANFSCLTTGTCPVGQTGSNFTLLYSTYAAGQPSGQAYYIPTNRAWEGFDQDGIRCVDAGSGTAPRANCPVRVDLSWVNRCAVVACNPALIEISVVFKYYRPHDNAAANRIRNSSYDFTLIKSVHPSPAGPTW